MACAKSCRGQAIYQTVFYSSKKGSNRPIPKGRMDWMVLARSALQIEWISTREPPSPNDGAELTNTIDRELTNILTVPKR